MAFTVFCGTTVGSGQQVAALLVELHIGNGGQLQEISNSHGEYASI